MQGDFFRYTTRKKARRLGLTGFVRNEPDGTVYIEAEGPEEDLEELLKFARRGPKQARVEKVDVDYSEPQGKYKGFDYYF